MMSLGYDEAARICLTHSFHSQSMEDYIGKFDTTDQELALIQDRLAAITMDEYDRLIQLCDSLAGADGVLNMETRMEDVRRRYGSYPQDKWNRNLELKRKGGEEPLSGGGKRNISSIRRRNRQKTGPTPKGGEKA